MEQFNGRAIISPTPDLTVDSDDGSGEPNQATTNSGSLNLAFGSGPPVSGAEDTASSSLEGFRESHSTAGISERSADLHARAWRSGTRAAYKSAWGQWVCWCHEREIDPVQSPISAVIDYLTFLYDKGLKYPTINAHRSAISKNHAPLGAVQVDQLPVVCEHMRAIFNERIPSPRYTKTWDVEKVLGAIKGWGDNANLSDKLLTGKLAMLLALTSAGRASELQQLDTRYMCIKDDRVTFHLTKRTKTCRPGKTHMVLEFFRFEEDRSSCVVECIEGYLSRSRLWQQTSDEVLRHNLLLSYVKPHGHVKTCTISRWLKDVMKESGLAAEFTAHSTRAASTSKAMGQGISVDDIQKTGKLVKAINF
ncbi:uncharacterized protein LOC124291013 [Haliotis rubra]|uniref:uncharacterized protein LOC124291013 n=1 Tax=Haliotis rubra TaxID=36100 RepID=UPI001EE50FA3|nr:uncharacterized protein LOC124291013 [Haliotis rubra]